MTEPENFDDELFADLYNDDEPAGKAARAAEPDQYSAAQSAAEVQYETSEDPGQQQDYNGGAVKYDEEEEDDDDEIDFNLGNGPSTTLTHHDHNDHHDHRDHQEDHDEKPAYNAPAAPVAHTKGPNAKEDG